MKKIILASGSPRRQELLSQIGIFFEVRTSDADESLQDQSPSEAVEELIFSKSSDVAVKTRIFRLLYNLVQILSLHYRMARFWENLRPKKRPMRC